MVLAWLLLLTLCMDCSCQLIVLIMLSDLASNTDKTHLNTCCFLCGAIKAVGCIDQATTYTVSSA